VSKSATLLCFLVLAAARVGAQELPLRDPLRPYTARPADAPAGAAEQGLTLTAVVIGTERRIAVINGAIRREGDRFDGVTLVRIERGAVRLRRAGEDWTVRLDGRAHRDDSGDSTP
jgi:MSHA biogenesis protein MshK